MLKLYLRKQKGEVSPLDKNFINTLINNYNINLNEQQLAAVFHTEGPAVILAVPGAGKTTVLVCRTANLILNHKINPKNLLSITFSKASAKDMKKRFMNIFGKHVSENINFSTIHSFAFFLIREYAYLNNIKYTLIEGNNQNFNKIKILKGIYHNVNGSYISDDKLEELLNAIGYIKNTMIDISDIHKFQSLQIKHLEDIFNKYEEYKKKNLLIDFDDMLTLALQILKSNKNMLNKYRNIYRYIQVDEGQDTSKIQNEIINLLAYPNNNLFIVADDDQSIYGFRGACPEDLINFNKKFTNAKTFYMEQNFRSTKNIVSVCNSFIKNNNYRYDKNLFTKNVAKRPVTIVKVKDEITQYEYLIKQLKEINDFSDTAILYRNNISSIILAEKLNRNGIPFYIRDSKLNFFNHWVVNDISDFLKLALDMNNVQSFENIYYKMKGFISKVAMQYVKNNNNSKSVFTKLMSFPNFKHFQLKNISMLNTDFKRLAKKPPYDAIIFIEKQLEYSEHLKKRCKNSKYSYEGIKSILSILKSIALETNSTVGFFARLEHLQNIIIESKNNNYKNAITLSTIHSSKGLEFKNVYMIDLIDGAFPSTSSIESYEMGQPKALEEERRLFYVGMTRAKEVLDLITFNEKNQQRVFYSRFINELEEIIYSSNSVNNPLKDILKVGSEIEHIKIGNGKITAINNNTITINFNYMGEKDFSLSTCIERNLLRPVTQLKH